MVVSPVVVVLSSAVVVLADGEGLLTVVSVVLCMGRVLLVVEVLDVGRVPPETTAFVLHRLWVVAVTQQIVRTPVVASVVLVLQAGGRE